jgi:sphingolipid 8-(E)-desaturase
VLVDNPVWFDWFHGGLNFQIEHHLFPRIPRVHFRRLQPIIQEFCLKHDLKYHNYGFIRGNGIVLDTLHQVAQQIRFLLASANSSHRFVSDDVKSK